MRRNGKNYHDYRNVLGKKKKSVPEFKIQWHGEKNYLFVQ